MILIPEKLIFLETPRTASRAVAEAMMKHCQGAVRSGCRHIHPRDVPRETGLPIYTFTRNPTFHAHSWFKYGLQQSAPWVFLKNGSRPMSFGEFLIAPFAPLQGIKPGRLNIYHKVADHFWPLEWHVDEFFLFVLNLEIKAEFVGAIPVPKQFSLLEQRLVDSQFHDDLELYCKAPSTLGHLKPLSS